MIRTTDFFLRRTLLEFFSGNLKVRNHSRYLLSRSESDFGHDNDSVKDPCYKIIKCKNGSSVQKKHVFVVRFSIWLAGYLSRYLVSVRTLGQISGRTYS